MTLKVNLLATRLIKEVLSKTKRKSKKKKKENQNQNKNSHK